MAQKSGEIFISEVGQVIFPNFAEANTVMVNGKPTGKPQFSASLLLDPNDTKELKTAIQRVAKEMFPQTKVNELQLPVHSGDKEAQKAEEKARDGGFYKGKLVLKARSDYKPVVVGPDNKELLDYGSIKSGDYGRLQVFLKAYDVNGNRGVKAFLTGFMLTEKGERLFGNDPQAGFAAYATTPECSINDTNTDSAEGSGDDDEMPF